MRADRLLQMVLLLQSRGGLTGAQLAEELEVSPRTIYRDLEALSVAGVPVVTARGPGGGCRLAGGYRTRLTGLSGREAEALFLSGVPGPAAELGFGALLATARRKLLAALPPGVGETARLAGQRFHLDPEDWFRSVPEHPRLADVAEAVWCDRLVALDYRRGDGRRVRREGEPLGLVLKAGTWYLVARIDGAQRAYRVERIDRVDLGESFTRDPDFDLAGFWKDWTREFESTRPAIEVAVRLSPVARTQLARDPALLRAPAGEETAADGWVRRSLVYERLDWARHDLLRLGGEVEVLAPPSLREEVAESARAVAALYGAPLSRRAAEA